MAVFSATKERKKLEKIVSCLPQSKIELCEGLIADAAFMCEELSKLREYLSANGWCEAYQHGKNQSGRKQPPEALSYISLQKIYVATIKQLSSFLPEDEPTDELMEFIQDKPLSRKAKKADADELIEFIS